MHTIQVICCDLPHGESSGTSSNSSASTSSVPPLACPTSDCLDDDEDDEEGGLDCCFDFVQPCDSPDCEGDTICDDLQCVISQTVPPCAGCGEARMEMRAGGVKKEEGGEGEGGGEHVPVEGEGGEGQVLECSCGFQDSWQEPCGYGEFDQFLDCCHPSYTPFPQIPIDLMSNQDPSGSSTTFGSPSIKSEASEERVPDFSTTNPFAQQQQQQPPPSSSDDLYSNFSILLDAALSSNEPPVQEAFVQQQQQQGPFLQQPSFDQQSFDNGGFLPSPAQQQFQQTSSSSPSSSFQIPTNTINDPSPLNCEWSDCNQSFPSLDQLVEHFKSTSSHLPVPDPTASASPSFSFDGSSLALPQQQQQQQQPVDSSMNALTCQWGSDPHLLTVAANIVMEENAAGQGAGGGAMEMSPSEILLQHLLRDHLAGQLPMASPIQQQQGGFIGGGVGGNSELFANGSPGGGGGGFVGPSLSDNCDPRHHIFEGDANDHFSTFGLHACEFADSLFSGSSSDIASSSDASSYQPHDHSTLLPHSHHIHSHSHPHVHSSHSHAHPHIHHHPYHQPHQPHSPHPPHSHAHLHAHHPQHHHPHIHPHPHHFAHPAHPHVHLPAAKIITPSRRSNSVTSLLDQVHACGYPNCDAVFEDTTALTDHINKLHVGSGKDSYACGWEGCERGLNGPIFKSKQKIMRHIQAHTGHKPFICPTCAQSFSEAATLAQHQRRHTNEKPFVCDHPGCEKAFTLVASLTIHKRTHDGIKPFACPHCDRAFVEASNLTKHIRTHTGDKPFPCLKCEKRFARPDQLSRHQSVHMRREAMAANGGVAPPGVGKAKVGKVLGLVEGGLVGGNGSEAMVLG